MPSERDEGVKKAAELLKQGATMLDLACPIDGLPLFRLRNGEIVCPVHGRVYVVENEEQKRAIEAVNVLDNAEQAVLNAIAEMTKKLKGDPSDPDAVTQMIRLLEALERLRRLKGDQSKSK